MLFWWAQACGQRHIAVTEKDAPRRQEGATLALSTRPCAERLGCKARTMRWLQENNCGGRTCHGLPSMRLVYMRQMSGSRDSKATVWWRRQGSQVEHISSHLCCHCCCCCCSVACVCCCCCCCCGCCLGCCCCHPWLVPYLKEDQSANCSNKKLNVGGFR